MAAQTGPDSSSSFPPIKPASREDKSTHARKDSTMPFTTQPLDASTWDAFAELVERNNGIFGGCWCIGFHPEREEKGISHRAVKEDRVRTGRAHAALVLDENGTAQGWCQYGSPEELPSIKHKREYDKDAPRIRTGASPASTSIPNIAATASHGRRWKARSTRSPRPAAPSSRPSPR